MMILKKNKVLSCFFSKVNPPNNRREAWFISDVIFLPLTELYEYFWNGLANFF